MALKKKTIPLLCALVILVSCLPVIPAAAADTTVSYASGSVSGFWMFNETLTRIGSYVCEPVSFSSAGMDFVSMNVYPGALRYALTSSDTGPAVASVDGATLSFSNEDYRLVYFGDRRQPVSASFYKWLVANAAPYETADSPTFDFDGSWYFDEAIASNDWLYILCDFCLVSDDTLEFNSLYFDSGVLYYEGDSGMVAAWSASDGWTSADLRSIAFLNGGTTTDEDTWSWLCCNAIQKTDPASSEYYDTSVRLADDVFLFTLDESGSPDVTVTVTSTGATLSCGYRVKTWTYTGEGTFGGLYDSAGSTYFPGSSIVLSGASGRPKAYEFYAAFSDDSDEPESLTLHAGQWEANKLMMTGEYVDLTAWPEGLNSVDLSFSSAGSLFSSMKYQYNVASGYRLCYDSTYAYNYDTLAVSPDPAWRSDAYALVYLAADQTVPEAFYTWFTSNFTRSGDNPVAPSYSTTVNIYDASGLVLLHTITFSGDDAAPVASLTVTQDGCTISCGDQTSSWAPASGAFYGFALSMQSSSVYMPGQSYTLPGGEPADLEINLYLASRDADGFATVIVIGDQFFEFSDPDVYPSVWVVPAPDKVGVGVDGGYSRSWIPSPPMGYSFSGLSLNPDSDNVDFPITPHNVNGTTIYSGHLFQGSASQNVVTLYPVYSVSSGLGGSDGSGSGSGGSGTVLDPAGIREILSDFFSTFVDPVMVFFNAQFIPGFSFSRLALVSCVLGLVFWLFKVTS